MIQEQINQLECELAEAEAQKESLEEATKDVERLNAQKKLQDKKLASLRAKITKASKQQGDQVLREQFEGLENGLYEAEKNIEGLNKLYPNGYPTKDEVAVHNKKILAVEQANIGLSGLVLKDEDIQCEAQGREVFGNEIETMNDIQLCQSKCNELTKVTAQATVQMSQEELNQRERLKKLFKQGVPTEQELQKYQEKIDLLAAMRGEWKANQLTEEETAQLSKLSQFFTGKFVDEQELEHCEEVQGQIKEWKNKLQEKNLTDTERNEWNRLSHIFSIEVPEDSIIQQKQNDCRRIDELNSKKKTKTVVFQPAQKQDTKKSKSSMWLIIIGALLLVAGVFGFVSSRIAIGAVFVIVGFVVLLVAFWMRTKQMVDQSSGQVAVESSAISEEEIQELYTLQRNVTEFLLKFYDDTSDPNENLMKLILEKQAYLQLKEKKDSIEQDVQTLRNRIDEHQEIVQNIFERYYQNLPYQERFVTEVRENWHNYNGLQERQGSLRIIRDGLTREMEKVEHELRIKFTNYYSINDTKELSMVLSQMKSDVQTLDILNQKWNRTREGREEAEKKRNELIESIELILKKYHAYSENQSYIDSIENLRNRFSAYQRAAKNVADFQNSKTEVEKQKINAEKELEQFAKQYGFAFPMNEKMLLKIADDIREHDIQLQQKTEALQKLENFKSQHPEYKNGLPEKQKKQEELPSAETLIDEEERAKNWLENINKDLQTARNRRKGLLDKVEQIPDMEDQVNRLIVKYKDAEKSCTILDATLKLLETAKNNLSSQYVGGVEQNFAMYVQELLGNDFRNALVDHDLTIRVDEKGEAREISYFSAGTVDCIMLCMRLALVDALFMQEKSFLLLDDPFVNLDDRHTAYALEMLKEIAKKKQIVYMVCNSSRR